MKFDKISLIGASTTRAKSYLQILCKNNFIINKVYLLSNKINILEDECKTYCEPTQYSPYFEINEPIIYTMKKYNIPYEILDTEDINSKLVIDNINNMQEDFLIYSGFPGGIVSEEILSLGKKFIHVHAGILPQFRGSTTAYYSMLTNNSIGASVIFLSSGIDEGVVIAKKEFPTPPCDVDIDLLYEPYIRSLTLFEAINEYNIKGDFKVCLQDDSKAQTFYVIHPVLKHIAIISNNEGKLRESGENI